MAFIIMANICVAEHKICIGPAENSGRKVAKSVIFWLCHILLCRYKMAFFATFQRNTVCSSWKMCKWHELWIQLGHAKQLKTRKNYHRTSPRNSYQLKVQWAPRPRRPRAPRPAHKSWHATAAKGKACFSSVGLDHRYAVPPFFTAQIRSNDSWQTEYRK